MLQCGFVRSNFSLAMAKTPVARKGAMDHLKSGAGRRNRTDIFSLEGCCTTIVLYPRGDGLRFLAFQGRQAPRPPTRYGVRSVVSKARGGGSRTRTCEAYAGDLQSPPFAARDIPPTRLSNRRNLHDDGLSTPGATKSLVVLRRLL